MSQEKAKRLRALELLLVLSAAFALSLYGAIDVWLSGRRISQNYTAGIISQLISLAVLVYVLFRQNRSLRQIGLTFNWLDIPVSVILAGLNYYAVVLSRVATFYFYHLTTGNVLEYQKQNSIAFSSAAIFSSLIYIVINPFKEELIVRAYTMSEVKYLTNSGLVAIAVSVLIQSSYHLYQGFYPALFLASGFLVFAVYYLKFKSITPIILAHLYLDIWAWLANALSRHTL